MEIFAKPLKISSFQANHNPFSRGRTKIVQMPIFCDIFYKNLLLNHSAKKGSVT